MSVSDRQVCGMSDVARQSLRKTLHDHYDGLRQRLTRKLGSSDAATAALHDVYLRLEQGGEIGPVARPLPYLFRMAMNAAHNRRRAERDLLTASDIADLLDVAEDVPDVERVVVARRDIETVMAALDALPRVRREIFLASWLDRKPQADIAAEHGVHKRTVQKEIERARAYLEPLFFDDDNLTTAFDPVGVSFKSGGTA